MKTSLELWTPGRDLAIDEAMCPFTGRSFDTVVIKNKPIPHAYKVWVEAQWGYFLAWTFHRKGKLKDKSKKGGSTLGPYNIPHPKALGDNSSAAVVAYLSSLLSTQGNIYYLDNLFTSTKLLKFMREKGFGVTGTCIGKSGILKDYSEMKVLDAKKDNIPSGHPL